MIGISFRRVCKKNRRNLSCLVFLKRSEKFTVFATVGRYGRYCSMSEALIILVSSPNSLRTLFIVSQENSQLTVRMLKSVGALLGLKAKAVSFTPDSITRDLRSGMMSSFFVNLTGQRMMSCGIG